MQPIAYHHAGAQVFTDQLEYPFVTDVLFPYAAVNVIIQVQKTHGGIRRIIQIAEVQGLEGDAVILHDRYNYVAGPVGGGGEFVEVTPRSIFEARLAKSGEGMRSGWTGNGALS